MVFKMLEGSDVSEGNFKLITPLKEINNGGAGSIWTLKGHPNFVLKLYHDTVDLSHYPRVCATVVPSHSATVVHSCCQAPHQKLSMHQ